MTAQEELEKAKAALIEINSTIFAKGAPLGSAEYFKIRELAAPYFREQQSGSGEHK